MEGRRIRAVLRLEEHLFLMTHKGAKGTAHAFATPRVLSPALAQTLAFAIIMRVVWLRYKWKARQCPELVKSLPLTTRTNIPDWMRDNPFITSGFRQHQRCWCGAVCSAGAWHNETFNIWSHGFAAIYFMNAFILSRRRHARWQALVAAYLFAMSACAHTGFVRGKFWDKLLFGMDRASIAVYFYAVSIFICKAHFLHRSPRVARLWAVACTLVSGGATAVLGGVRVPPWASSSILISQMAFGAIPVFREYFVGKNPYIATRITKYLGLCVLWGLAGAIAFATRLPERRLPPGVVDYLGNSHNIMHVCVGMATFFAYRGSFLWELELQRKGTPIRSLWS